MLNNGNAHKKTPLIFIRAAQLKEESGSAMSNMLPFLTAYCTVHVTWHMYSDDCDSIIIQQWAAIHDKT